METPFILALTGLPDTPLANRLHNVLPAAEWQWIQRLHQPADRLRSLCGRAALRILLARCLDMPTADIPLCIGAWGKPMLATPPGTIPDWHFNISHSADQVWVAIGRQPLGIDVEACPSQVDPLLYQLITNQPFEPAKQTADALDFCRQWVCRESILKAYGTGLSVPMGTLQLQADTSAWWRVSGLPCAGLHVRLLRQSDDYCAALCLPDTISIWQLHQQATASWFCSRI